MSEALVICPWLHYWQGDGKTTTFNLSEWEAKALTERCTLFEVWDWREQLDTGVWVMLPYKGKRWNRGPWNVTGAQLMFTVPPPEGVYFALFHGLVDEEARS